MTTTTPDAPLPTALTLDQLTKIISDAKSGSQDPLSMAVGIFGSLAPSVSVSGDLLRQALTGSGIPLKGPLSVFLNGIQSVSKSGNQVKAISTEPTEVVFKDSTIRLLAEVVLDVSEDEGLPALTNITGIAVHKLGWLNIETVAVKKVEQQTVLHIVTPLGSRDIALG